MGTIGGSVAHGDPAGDLPAVLLALDASFVITGAGGATRTVEAASFFTGLFSTALEPNELLTEIRVPKTSGGWSFLKFNRRAQDWALVGVSAVAANGGVHVGPDEHGADAVARSRRRGGRRRRRGSRRRGRTRR